MPANLKIVRDSAGRARGEHPDLLECLRVLEAVVADRGILATLDGETRRRLLTAAGRVSRPSRNELRALAKALRRQDRRDQRDADETILRQTRTRQLRQAPVFLTPAVTPERPSEPPAILREPRKCYVCKAGYREVHFFYDQLCPECASLNYAKRHQSAPLPGRTALVTGARVKIGYQAAIKLLRSGARVIATTRFPRDAAKRYSAEEDFSEWGHRLEVYGLDLRHTPSVERFAHHLLGRLDRLDFILHNACQTVRRPAGFYAHLTSAEAEPLDSLCEPARQLVAATEAYPVGRSAQPEPTWTQDMTALSDAEIFPTGALDADLQQVDLRTVNSWRLTLGEVPTVELLEVHLVNAIAPFVLSSRLKPLMLRNPSPDRHIVNVSAVEGQFYREHKTDKHPHTNMAKAALNMLTRTSAADYVKDGIHMNSVDTGWITDEDPVILASRKTAEHGFYPPLDVVDGAARICDPVFSGFLSGEHAWGQFFKDYRPTAW
jgi:NAD(P)-dependent dehydrogenase (short-subunit alcohol dehydrogenase family)